MRGCYRRHVTTSGESPVDEMLRYLKALVVLQAAGLST